MDILSDGPNPDTSSLYTSIESRRLARPQKLVVDT